MISVKNQIAVRALMDTNAQIFGHNHTTTRAHLGRVSWGHGNDLGSSFFHFLLKELPEHPQPSVVCAQGEMMIVRHKRKVQILDREQRICVCEVACNLVPEVPALIRDMFVHFGNLKGRTASPARPLFAPGQTPLFGSQFCKTRSQPTRVINQSAVGQSQQAMQTDVNANLWASVLGNIWFGQIDLETNIPFAKTALHNYVFDLGVLWNISVVLNLDLSDVPDVKQRAPAIVKSKLAAVSVAELNTLPAIVTFESRESGLFARLNAPEECSVSLVQTPKRLLHTGGIQEAQTSGITASQITKVRPLRRVCDAVASFFVDRDSLLKGSIIHAARQLKKIVHLLGLLGMRIKAVLERTDHLATFLLFDVMLDSFSRNMPCGSRVVTTSPQRWEATFELGKLLTQLVAG